MEKYSIERKENVGLELNKGEFNSRVLSKHKENYGELSAKSIENRSYKTFGELMKIHKYSENKNALLVGKVQSGKTANLEMITALALDNDFRIVVIYGGYDNRLLNQTIDRFKSTFEITGNNDPDDEEAYMFSTNDPGYDLSKFDRSIIHEINESKKPIFIVSLKNPTALKKVNNFLKKIILPEDKALIIDDEGDQASLNTEIDKKNDKSATYNEICVMKKIMNNPLYLSVTATPHANVFLDDFSQLKPSIVRLIEPAIGYCGADVFHMGESDLIKIIDVDPDENLFPSALFDAIHHFLIASSILLRSGNTNTEMIIHTHRKKSDHKEIQNRVILYLDDFKRAIDAEDSSLKARKEELNKIYLDTFSEETITCYNFDDLFDSICSRVLTKTHVILHNSDSSYIDSLTNFRKHRIYIGGDLLQRGLTFSKLTTSYFTRWPKSSGNMDTTLQRARWFGYRENYINFCKVFLTEEIAEEFYNLSETENDLWDQFYEIEEEKRTISDILIKIDSDSNLRPTRKNVANIISPRFRERWITQRQGIFDQNLIQDNNNYVRSLIEKNTLLDTRVGRRDDTISAQYFELGKNEVVEMIENLDSIFGNDSRFNKQVLLKKISMQDSTPIIIMNKEKPRERSFYTNNNIFALHQGRSNDNDTGKYLGDAEVIIDKNRINIQIHSIIPKINNGSDKKVEYQQFMIAVFDPQSQDKYFARED